MIFPIVEIEKEIQIGDKTRISAMKSFVSLNSLPIEEVSIALGMGATPIVISPVGIVPTTSELWYTDWIWTAYAFDLDSTCNKIDFEEAGVAYVATVATLSYSSVSDIATAMQTALNAAGATGTFTVSVDENYKITIASTVAFKLLLHTGVSKYSSLLPHVGFNGYDTVDSLSQIGMPVEYGRRKITVTCGDSSVDPDVDLVTYQHVFTEYGDRLFCSDDDLLRHEEDLLKWVIDGRSSHKDQIRRAQKIIIDSLLASGYVNAYHQAYTKWDILDLGQVREWSTYLALQLIFEGNSNAVDDIFDRKAKKYSSLVVTAKNRYLSLDIDKDGKIDFDENLRLQTINLFRR